MQDISKDEALIKAKSEYELLQEEIQKLQAEIASLMISLMVIWLRRWGWRV